LLTVNSLATRVVALVVTI